MNKPQVETIPYDTSSVTQLPGNESPRGATCVKLDQIDLQILIELQKNGRITNFDLSTRVGISPSPCHKRMRRLEKTGMVKGYRADIAWWRLFSNLTVYAFVSLRKHGLSDFQMFERHVRKHPQITACFSLSGTYSYLLRFDCRDLNGFVATSKELLAQIAGIERLDSHIVLSQIKDDPVPLAVRRESGAGQPAAASASRHGVLVSLHPNSAHVV